MEAYALKSCLRNRWKTDSAPSKDVQLRKWLGYEERQRLTLVLRRLGQHALADGSNVSKWSNSRNAGHLPPA
jgi:hypothetical protein